MLRMTKALAPTESSRRDRFWKRYVTEVALRNVGTHELKLRAWRGCDAEDPQKAQEEIDSGRER